MPRERRERESESEVWHISRTPRYVPAITLHLSARWHTLRKINFFFVEKRKYFGYFTFYWMRYILTLYSIYFSSFLMWNCHIWTMWVNKYYAFKAQISKTLIRILTVIYFTAKLWNGFNCTELLVAVEGTILMTKNLVK